MITIYPHGQRLEVRENTSILALLQAENIHIRSDCGGRGGCGSCKVIVTPAISFSPPSIKEEESLGEDLSKGLRLACQAQILGDGSVTIIPDSQLAKAIVLEENYAETSLEIKPAVRRVFLEVHPADLDNPLADGTRLQKAMLKASLDHVALSDLSIIEKLPLMFERAKGQITALVWQEGILLDLVPGDQVPLLGAAIDLGTTTVVVYLFDLVTGELISTASALNPQSAYGSDVISRINYASQSIESAQRLQTLITQAINNLLKQACETARVDPGKVMEVVLVGNTVMHHLFLGLDTRKLGLAPYVPVWVDAVDAPSKDYNLAIHPAANVHFLPNKAGFVGSDCMAVLLSVEEQLTDKLQLIIDFGTNGELLLACRQQIWACSTAAGPAFEGAKIRHGMLAQEGAIDRVEWIETSDQFKWNSIGEVPPKGICGTGLISAAAAFRQAGLLEDNGRFNTNLHTHRFQNGFDGIEFILAFPEETDSGKAIVISQADIRELQLAKAAVAAGCRVLMRQAGTRKLHSIILAGAFGSYIRPEDAIAIGIIPDLAADRIKIAGNAAGHGASLALLNIDRRQKVVELTQQVQYIELAGDERFEEIFIHATYLKPWNIIPEI